MIQRFKLPKYKLYQSSSKEQAYCRKIRDKGDLVTLVETRVQSTALEARSTTMPAWPNKASIITCMYVAYLFHLFVQFPICQALRGKLPRYPFMAVGPALLSRRRKIPALPQIATCIPTPTTGSKIRCWMRIHLVRNFCCPFDCAHTIWTARSLTRQRPPLVPVQVVTVLQLWTGSPSTYFFEVCYCIATPESSL